MAKKTMIDPLFGEISFTVDAWYALVPFEDERSGTLAFAVHIWADPSGPTASQRATFKELKRRYETLWPVIAETMVKCHPRLSSVDRCREYVDPTVGCYIQNKASRGHDDFELVYELRDEPGRGIFVRIAGWDVVESAVAK